jgi:type IV pilus assembly protein PilE
MKSASQHQQNGFTLVELMIVIAIVGILMFVAYPSYQGQVTDSKRADAQTALTAFASAMERHFTATNTYLNAGASGSTGTPKVFAAEAPVDGSSKSYDLTIQAATATSYTLRATPKYGQAGDGYLNLTSIGIRQWDKNNDGSIGSTESTWSK